MTSLGARLCLLLSALIVLTTVGIPSLNHTSDAKSNENKTSKITKPLRQEIHSQFHLDVLFYVERTIWKKFACLDTKDEVQLKVDNYFNGIFRGVKQYFKDISNASFSVSPHLISVRMVEDGYLDTGFQVNRTSGRPPSGVNHTADHVIVWQSRPAENRRRTGVRRPADICLRPYSISYLRHFEMGQGAWLRAARSMARILGALNPPNVTSDSQSFENDPMNGDYYNDTAISLTRDQMSATIRGLGKHVFPRNCLLDHNCDDLVIDQSIASEQATLSEDQLCFRWFGNDFTATYVDYFGVSANVSRCQVKCLDNDTGQERYLDKDFAVCRNLSTTAPANKCVPLALSREVPDDCLDYLDSCSWGALYHPHLCYERSLSLYCCLSCRRAAVTLFDRKVYVRKGGLRELRVSKLVGSKFQPVNQTCYRCGSLHRFSLDCTGWDRSRNVSCLAGGCWTYERYQRIRNAWTHSGRAYYRGCRDLRTRDLRHQQPRQNSTGLWYQVKHNLPKYFKFSASTSDYSVVGTGLKWTRCNYDFCNGDTNGYVTLVLAFVGGLVSLYTVVMLVTICWDYGRIPQQRCANVGLVDPRVELLIRQAEEKTDKLGASEVDDSMATNNQRKNSVIKKHKSVISKCHSFANGRPRKIQSCAGGRFTEQSVQKLSVIEELLSLTPDQVTPEPSSVPPDNLNPVTETNFVTPSTAITKPTTTSSKPPFQTQLTPPNLVRQPLNSSFTLPTVEVTKPVRSHNKAKKHKDPAKSSIVETSTTAAQLIDVDSNIKNQPKSMPIDKIINKPALSSVTTPSPPKIMDLDSNIKNQLISTPIDKTINKPAISSAPTPPYPKLINMETNITNQLKSTPIDKTINIPAPNSATTPIPTGVALQLKHIETSQPTPFVTPPDVADKSLAPPTKTPVPVTIPTASQATAVPTSGPAILQPPISGPSQTTTSIYPHTLADPPKSAPAKQITAAAAAPPSILPIEPAGVSATSPATTAMPSATPIPAPKVNKEATPADSILIQQTQPTIKDHKHKKSKDGQKPTK